MNPLAEYVSEYADALGRQFKEELSEVREREESVRSDTDATIHIVEASTSKASLPSGTLRGLDVAVRQYAAQHGFEFSRSQEGDDVTYEMYPSPAIEFPTEVSDSGAS